MSVDWSVNEYNDPADRDPEKYDNDNGRPNNDGRQPNDNGGRPNNDGRQPNDNGGRPNNDGRQPNDNARRPNNDGRRPSNDRRQPNDDRRRPNDESNANETNDDNSSLDVEDETLSERLLGLAEMFPEPVSEGIDQVADFLHTNFKKIYWFSKQSTWIVETCTLILLAPILLSYCSWKKDAALDPGPCGSRSSCGSMIGRTCHLSRPWP